MLDFSKTKWLQTRLELSIVRRGIYVWILKELSVIVGYGGGSFSRHLNGNNNGGEVSPSSNRLNSQISFSSLLPSSLGMLSQISEQVGNEKLANTNGDAQFFTPTSGFPFASWNESSQFSETFPGVKRDPDSTRTLFSSSHQVYLA